MSLYRTIHNSFQSSKIFTLDIPHGNFTACYDDNSPYLGITQDETMAVEISQHQFSICHTANGQFFNIHAPFQPLANPPSCITALYTKNTASISTGCSLQIRKTQNISIPSQIAHIVWILTDYSSFCSNNCNHSHLPRRNNKISYSEETHSCLVTTTCMQCYITKFSSATMI